MVIMARTLRCCWSSQLTHGSLCHGAAEVFRQACRCSSCVTEVGCCGCRSGSDQVLVSCELICDEAVRADLGARHSADPSLPLFHPDEMKSAEAPAGR